MIKQKFVSILSIITFVCLILLSFCLSIREICIDTFTDRVIETKILNEVIGDIKNFTEVDYKARTKIKNNIINNPNIKSMTSKYFDNFIISITNNKDVVVPNVNKELNNLINNCEGVFSSLDLNDEQKDVIRSSIRKNRIINEFYVEINSEIRESLTSEHKQLIKIYNILNSKATCILLLVVIIINIALILLLSKSILSIVKGTSIIFLLSGVFSLGVVPLTLKIMSNEVFQLLSILSSNITLDRLSMIAEIYIVIGVILYVIYEIIIIAKKIKNKEKIFNFGDDDEDNDKDKKDEVKEDQEEKKTEVDEEKNPE